MPAIHDININRRNSWQLDVTLLDSVGAAIDLTGSEFTATVYRDSSGPGFPVVTVDGTLTDAGAGEARLSMDSDVTGALPSGQFRWELEWTDAQGEPWDLLAGQANVSDQQQGQQVDVVELTVTSEQVSVTVQVPGTQGPAGPEGPTGPADSHGNEDHDAVFATEGYVDGVASNLIIDVKQVHGAAGNGTTDDTAAIQAAIDAVNTAGGGIVWFPQGDYAFTRLTIKSDVMLWGAGRAASFLLCTDDTAGSALVKADDGNRVARFGMQNLGLGTAKSSVGAAQDANQDVIGLNLAACEHGQFSNLYIAGFGEGAVVLARAEGGAEGLGFTSTTQDGNYNTFIGLHVAASGLYNADGAAVWFKYKANSNEVYGVHGKGSMGTLVVFAHGNDNLVSGAAAESMVNSVYFKGLAANNTVIQARGEGLSGAIVKADAPDTTQVNNVFGVHQSGATMFDLAVGARVRFFAAGVNRLPGEVELPEAGEGVKLTATGGTQHTFTTDADGLLVSSTAGGFATRTYAQTLTDDRFKGAAEGGETFGSPVLDNVNAWPVWLLDSASSEQIGFEFYIPSAWSTFDIVLVWTNVSPFGAGDVRFRYDYDLRSAGQSLASSSGTAATVTATEGAVIVETAYASGVSRTAPYLRVKPTRLGGDGADTLGNDIGVLGVIVRRAS